MKEINYKEMRFNPFNLIGGEWMLVTAGGKAELGFKVQDIYRCMPYFTSLSTISL